MGVLFLEHMGGRKPIDCRSCGVNLTNEDQMISQRFSGVTGPACLFNKVVNVTMSERKDRQMMTGRHIIRDIHCKKCKIKLGWFYEFAFNDCQMYKEGKYVLEKALISVGIAV